MVAKEDLQESAKNVYLNITTFADLAIGYALAIFVTNVTISRWLVLTFVAVLVVILLLAECFGIAALAKKKYPTDRRVYNDERKPQKGEIVYTATRAIEDDSKEPQ